MAMTKLSRFAFVIFALAFVQIEAHQHVKRTATTIVSKLKRGTHLDSSKSDIDSALIKREEYTSLHCPDNTNCIEVADNEMWDGKNGVTGCNDSGMTCQFSFGGGATAKCPDKSTASVRIHSSAESPDASTITIGTPQGKAGPFMATGTFGGIDSHIMSTTDSYVSSYLDCIKV